jgi:hypothetical protein
VARTAETLHDLAKHVHERRQGMPHRDRQHGGAVDAVQEISAGLFLGDGTAPAAAPRDQGGRQHLANEAVRDQLPEILDLRGDTRLGPDHAQDSLGLSKRGEFLGLGQPVTERPFAVDVLAGLDRRLHDFQMMRHLHRDGDDVDLGRRDQLGDIGKGPRQTGRSGRLFSTGEAGVGNADDLVALGERMQRGDMGPCRPAPAWLQPDYADPETLPCHDVQVPVAQLRHRKLSS